MPTYVRRLLLGIGVFLLQWLVLGRLSIYGAYPDVLLLLVAWFALQDGRRTGTIFGFLAGVAMDVAYGTWGVHMLVKTLVGFLLGAFAVDEREPLSINVQQAFLGALVVALLHNAILIGLLALQTRAANDFLIFNLWLGSAVYTSAVAVLLSLFRN